MISSLTNQHKSSVHIDRIVVEQENKPGYISTEPDEIKKQVEEYYSQAFKKRNTNFQQLNKEWKDQYKPKEYINADWYKDLMKPPSD